MNDHGLVKIDPAVLVLIRESFDKDGLLRPFCREIMLIECHIAGTAYHDAKKVEEQLVPGLILPLLREPQNPHDPLAIAILTEAGARLGYVPRIKNEALARLMDAGKLLFGKIESKEWLRDWLKVSITIYMRDF